MLQSPVAAASMLWYSGKRPADPAKLPQLRAFSDVLWGFWNRGNPNIKNINYFFMMGIVNEETNRLIATCLRSKRETLRFWPGVSFDTTTDEGHALLGSPNGAAFAYFLMQHKAELGNKRISKITVFTEEQNEDMLMLTDPNLVFYVEDVPEEKHVAGDVQVGDKRDGSVHGNARVSPRAFKL